MRRTLAAGREEELKYGAGSTRRFPCALRYTPDANGCLDGSAEAGAPAGARLTANMRVGLTSDHEGEPAQNRQAV